MTSILDEFKRREGDQLSDWTAPRTSEASKTIITDSLFSFTVLTHYGSKKNKHVLAKVWTTGEAKTPHIKKVIPKIVQAENLSELHALLTALSPHSNSAIIRGELTTTGESFSAANKHVYRRCLPKDGIAPHFKDTPRKWVCFDCDKLITRFDIRTQAEQAVAFYVKQLRLPDNVGYVWQLSGSAGKPNSDPFLLKAHVWMFLDEARTSKQVKDYYKEQDSDLVGLVDLALFNPVQWHYTAAPINALADYTDPCQQRLGVVLGDPIHVPIVQNVDLSFIKTAKTKRELSTKTQRAINAANVSGAFATTFQKTVALNALERGAKELRNTSEGARHNTLNRILYYLYGYVYSGALDEGVMIQQLKEAALSTGITYERFRENVEGKKSNYAPLDQSLLSDFEDIEELIPQSNKPLVIDPKSIWAALGGLNEHPKKLDDCLTSIQEINDPLEIVKLTAYTVNLVANNAPFRYSFDDSIAQLKDILGDKIHPLTFAACIEWGRQTGAYIKARAAKGIVISEEVKARHIHQTIDKVANAIPLNEARVMVVRVAMGEGKTAILGRGLRDLAQKENKRFAALTHRSALVDEMCRVLDLTHYQNVGELLGDSRVDKKKIYSFFGSCLHSIASPFIRTVYEKCDVLFIDEAAQKLRALVGIYNKETSTARDSTAQDVYDLLVKAIRTAPKVVLCDAGANDELIEWLESILGTEKINIVETSKKSGDGIDVTFNFANQQLQGESAAIEAIKARLAQGKRVWISVGTVKAGRLIESKLKSLGRGKFIHSKTPTAQKREFLSDVDRESLKYDYVIATPVISCGTSVTHRDGHHFDDVFYIGDGSSVVPQDVLQMIRRVRYVKKIQVYSWLPLRQRLGDTTQEKRITDFYSLKTHLTANINWERQNYNAALCHTLESAGFNVTYQEAKGNMRDAIAGYQVINEQRAFDLNSAPTLTQGEYEALKRTDELTALEINALDKFELNEHLAQETGITPDDLRLWGEGRGRELLARRAACRGIVLQGVEHSPVLCDLYGQIFEGVDIENLATLDQATAQTIVQNAISVGRVGVQYELLPQSYARKNRQPKSAMKSALVILQQCGYEKDSIIRPQSPNDLSNSGDCGQTSRDRLTLLDRTLIEQLDAVIERLNFREDILDEPTITRPLPDKVTKREFLTTQSQEDPIFFDDDLSAFENDPFFTPVKTSQQITALDPLRYSSMVKCVDCGFFDEKGVDCLVHGEIALPDALRACDAFSVKEQCA